MKPLLTLIALLSATALQAQVVQWRIHPNFNSLRLSDTNDAIVTDSAGVSTIWDLNGRRLVSTPDRIMPLFDGFAASVSSDLNRITGIYRTDGSFTDLSNSGYGVAMGYPYFEGQYLVVRQGKAGYNIIDSKGRPRFRTPYPRIYPFSNGYASCMGYINPKKQTGPCCLYYDDKFTEVTLTLKGKKLQVERVQYLSTIADDGRGIALINNRFYFFEAATRNLTPILTSKEEHVHLELAFEQGQAIAKGTVSEPAIIKAAGAKGEEIQFQFDRQGFPVAIVFSDQTVSFPRNPRHLDPTETNIWYFKDEASGLYGITLDNDTLLPAQFDAVPALIGDDAIVRLGDKFGQIHVDRQAYFQVEINKSEDIAFLHRTAEVPLRIDMPSYISPVGARIISGTRGMQVDQASIQARQNRNGSYAEFNCELSFPFGLSADSLAQISYPIQLEYEGLTTNTLYAKANAWHFKYFDVRVPTSEIEIKDGNVKFNFYIERTNNEKTYPFEVEVDANGLPYTLDKISESYYQCRIQRLKEGDNSIVVQVTEQGCPPVSCPVDVTYKKPVAKTEGAAPTKKQETVAIKVKKAPEAKPKPAKKVIIPI